LCATSCPICVVGDFNIGKVNWSTYDCPDDGVSNILVDCFLSNSLIQYVTSHTRQETILDLILCSDFASVINVKVSAPFTVGCDHRQVLFSLLNLSVSASRAVSRVSKDFRHTDFVGLGDFLSTLNWTELFLGCMVPNDFFKVFHDVMIGMIEIYVPSKKVFQNSALKLPKKLRKLRARKKFLYNRRNNTLHRAQYINICKQFQRELRAYLQSLERKCVNSADIMKFYAYANKKLKSRSGIAPLRREDGSLTVNDAEKCDIVNKFFCSVFTIDNGALPTFARRVPVNVGIETVIFTPEKVASVIKSLPNKCSGSPDGLPALFLKKLSLESRKRSFGICCISGPLSIIYNVCMMSGLLPDIFLTADVVPVFKKGIVSEPGNYRPVSLTCITSKIMERVVKNEVSNYLRTNNIITKDQHGFLAQKSVESQMLECMNLWTRFHDTNSCVDIVYLDFKKAFDSVCHSKLLIKLESYGIGGSLLKFVSAFLHGRTQRVVINNASSDYSPVLSGVPQGSVTGPLWFILYINDLPDLFLGCPDISTKIFADDVKISCAVSQNINVQSNLCHALSLVCDWATEWQLNLSAEKSAVLHMGNRNPSRDYNLNDSIVPLQSVTCMRDLGILVRSDLSVRDHCVKVASQALQKVGIIFRSFVSCDVSLLVRAYTTYARPILECSTVVWSPHRLSDISRIERVQRQFTLRCFLRCGLGHPSYERRCELLGLQSLENRRKLFDL
jgi:hypothetical protein